MQYPYAPLTLLLFCALAVAKDDTAQQTTRLDDVELIVDIVENEKPISKPAIKIIEQAQIAASGYIALGDFLGAQSMLDRAIVGNAVDSDRALIDLRHLGPNRTLVLVNGHRWITGLDNSVDLNTIPIAAVERIEILRDGASAIYGSDAIGGVINIVLIEEFEGLEASTYYGAASAGDGDSTSHALTYGVQRDRLHVLANFSYQRIGGIRASDRGWTNAAYYGVDPNDSLIGGADLASPYGNLNLIRDAGAGITLIPGRSGNAREDYRDFDFRTDGYHSARFNYLQVPIELKSAYLKVDHELDDRLTFNATAIYSGKRSVQYSAPKPFLFGSQTLRYGDQVVISADNIYNPLGREIPSGWYRPDLPSPYTVDSGLTYLELGLTARNDWFDREWHWNVKGSHSVESRKERDAQIYDYDRLESALGPGFVDENGRAYCGTPSAIVAGCVPANLFGGPAGFTQAMMDYVAFTAEDRRRKSFSDYAIDMTTSLFDLPAGALDFATGLEYRRESAYDRQDPRVAAGTTTGGLVRQPIEGEYAAQDAYIEFKAPLVRDSNFAQSLQLSAAARYSDYSNFGHATKPKIGLSWQINNAWSVEGNYGKGFRAPGIGESFAQGSSEEFVAHWDDPCFYSSGQAAAVYRRCREGFGGVNPATEFTMNHYYNLFWLITEDNPNLRPEESINQSLGVDYRPPDWDGLDVGLHWYRIRISGLIEVLSPEYILYSCYVAANEDECANIYRWPSGGVWTVHTRKDNSMLGRDVEGLDLDVHYGFDTGIGLFDIDWESAYTLYNGDLGQPNRGEPIAGGVSDSFGDRSGYYLNQQPNWRLRSSLSATWKIRDWQVELQGRYLSSLKESCTVLIQARRQGMVPQVAHLCSDPSGSEQFPEGENRLPAKWYWNAQLAWQAPWRATISAGVHNLFGEQPPVAYSAPSNSFDPRYEIPGRFWYASYRQTF